MATPTAGQTRQTIQVTDTRLIVGHDDNVRENVGNVDELAASIRAHGILQPLIVTEHPSRSGRWLLLAGHRRLAGARKAGLERVPVLVRHGIGDAEELHTALMLVENHQRRQLSPMEKARAIGRLLDAGMSKMDVSRATGMGHSSVTTYATLLELDDDTAEALEEGDVTAGDAVAAVRRARAEQRKRKGTPVRGRPIVVERHHLTWSHPLADVVRQCTHSTRPMIGGSLGCGQCWEDAIRADERTRTAAGDSTPTERGGVPGMGPDRVAPRHPADDPARDQDVNGDVDEVAVERALAGDESVALTDVELLEVDRRRAAARAGSS